MKMFKLLASVLVAIALPLAAQAPKSIQPPPVPAVPTPTEQAIADINTFSLSSYRTLVRLQRDGINLLWHSPLGLTPQQVCDAKGNSAAALFRDHGTLTSAIATIAQANGINPATGINSDGIKVADGLLLPTNAFAVNQDGTVTIDPNTPYTP